MERRSSHDEKKSGRMDDVYDERHVQDALFLYAKSMLLRHTLRTANVKAGPDAQRQEDLPEETEGMRIICRALFFV